MKIKTLRLPKYEMAFILCFLVFSSSAQENTNESKTSYLEFAVGLASSNFIDFATSPLSYSGNPFYVSLAHTEIYPKRTSQLNATYIFGNYANSFNDQLAKSDFKSMALSYMELFTVNSLSNQRREIKLGGLLNSTANFRTNPYLFNATKGLEVIGTLFGSIQTGLNFHNSGNLFLTANIGLINTSYRNGFAYVNQGALLNNDDFFDGYAFTIFSGFRLMGDVAYRWPLENHNALQLSYQFDAYRTSKDNSNFQMAYHILKLSFQFNLK